MMIAWTFQVTLKRINQYKIIDNTNVPLALVMGQKWVTHAKPLTMVVLIFAQCTWSNKNELTAIPLSRKLKPGERLPQLHILIHD